MCSVQLDGLHDKSAARQTPSGRQRGCPSVLPSISAILGQQQLPNATTSRVDFLIYTGTKFLLKILLPQRAFDAAGYLHHASISAGEGEGGENISVLQGLISAAGWGEDQKGANVLLTGFKVRACMCSPLSIMQLKCSLTSFSLFALIGLIHRGCFDIFIFISKLCAIFYAGYIASQYSGYIAS